MPLPRPASAPNGEHAAKARQRIVEITQADRAEAAAAEASNSPATAEKKSSGARWTWIAAGAAMIGAGVAVDLIPDSSSNGELDALDFAPVALYGIGIGLGVMGTF